MVAFADKFVGQLQENQRFRYNQVMQALNMSAALTARKTKEFRSPPQEQVKWAKTEIRNIRNSCVKYIVVVSAMFQELFSQQNKTKNAWLL